MKTAANTQVMRKKYFKKWMLIPACIIIVLFLLWALVLAPSATVQVALATQHLTAKNTLTANVNNSTVNISSQTIPAYYVEVNESSSSSANTTGSKEVGNNATGNVTVYNTNNPSFTIPAGTLFITDDSNAYEYTLNTSMVIPTSNGTPVSQTAGLTAKNIGAQYNIGSGVNFVIQNQSIPTRGQGVSAVSSSNFQGGTSSQAQVVAQSDQDNLLKSLEQQLYAKGKNDLAAKYTGDMVSVDTTIANQDVSKSFDSNVGDKATILNLSLTTKTSILVYKKGDINSFLAQIFQKQVGRSQTVTDIVPDIQIVKYDSGTGDITMKVSGTAVSTPSVNTANLSNTIKNKSIDFSLNYIKSLTGVKNVNIDVGPFWMKVVGRMPFSARAIHIKTAVS